MKKILLTGFEPFGGEKVNPSWEVARRCPNIKSAKIIKIKLPVLFDHARQILDKAIRKYRPDIIISMGQYGGGKVIRLERVGVNIHTGVDENKKCPSRECIIKNSPVGYLASLPIKRIAGDLRQAKIPYMISYSAGTYICNEVMYSALHHIASNNLSARAGFIHLPKLPSQAKGNDPSMSLLTMLQAMKIVIRSCLK